MGTRATYRFHGDEHTPTVTIYNHYDNYPSGAAEKLYAGYLLAERGFAAGFLRANDKAEHAISHEIHSDTEYRYDIRCDQVAAGGFSVEVRGRNLKLDEWRTEFYGEIVEFFASHGHRLLHLESVGGFGEQWLSLEQAEAKLEEQTRMLGIWAANGNGGYNFEQMRERILALRQLVADSQAEGDA